MSSNPQLRFWGVIWLALVGFAPALCLADASALFTRGLLWKIERPNFTGTPSYVFGTIHSDEPSVAKPPPASAALASSRVFMMELLPDADAMATVAQALLSSNGTSLKALLGPSLFAKTERALAERGIPQQAADRLAPWAATVALSMPKLSGGLPLDLALYGAAQSQSKPVLGIETAAEQTAVFTSLSQGEQIALLKDTLDYLPQIDQALVDMHRLYVARDLGAMVKLNDKYAPRDAALARKVLDALIDSRNQRMAQRIEGELQKGGAFVAVGALHLPGQKGLLNLLRLRGYRVSVVY